MTRFTHVSCDEVSCDECHGARCVACVCVCVCVCVCCVCVCVCDEREREREKERKREREKSFIDNQEVTEVSYEGRYAQRPVG